MFQNSKLKIQSLKQGFSLLELLIYIAILAIVMVILATSFATINKGRGKAEAQVEVNSNMRFALMRIGQDIKNATSITTPATNATSSSFVGTVSGSQVAYCVVSGVLRRQVAGACSASSEAITSNSTSVSNIVFSRLENANTDTGKTAVSIEVVINIGYAGTNPDWQYSGSKKSTFLMY